MEVVPYTHNNSTQIEQYTLNGDFVQEYGSISQAAKTLNISPSGISNCVNGYSKKSGGYVWKYKSN